MVGTGVVAALMAFVVAAPAAAAPSWHLQRSGQGGFLTAVSAPDPAHAWAVGGGGRVLATSNGGDSWQEQSAAAGGGANLYGVSFVDEDHGWAVGAEETILATSDGGSHWAAQRTGSGGSPWLLAVSFVDSQHGWAVGEGGLILATTDGGTTWAPQSSGVTVSLNGVSFVNDQVGWAVGAAGTILKTTDGGTTWTKTTTAFNPIGVSAVDPQHAWVVGTLGGIAHTGDGVNWAVQTSGTTRELTSVSFADDEDGWAVGAAGTILATTDGGATWTPQASGTGEQLFGVSSADSTHASAVGFQQAITSYFEPGPAARLEVTAPSNATAGTPFTFGVKARDAIGHLATGYAGTVHFHALDPKAVVPADSTLTEGSGTFGATLKTASTAKLFAEDGALSAASGSIVVGPGPASELTLFAYPSSTTAGTLLSFHVTAFDQFGNVATGYAGNVHFTSSDGLATLPSDSTLTAGERTFDATLRTAGTQTIGAGDGTLSASTVGIVVRPGPTAKLAISTPAGVTAGLPFPFGVQAFDEFGNATPSYSGTIHFTSSDPSATLPADAALVSGTGSFEATLDSGGEQTISGTDVADSSITTTSFQITVGKVTPTLAVLASPGVTLGAAIHASATIDGVDPSGRLEFALYGPDDPSCAGAPVDVAATPIDGPGRYDSPSFTPTAAGTYRWVATYPGDGANLGAATGCADPAAAVTIAAAPARPQTQETPPAPQAQPPAPPSPPAPRVTVSYNPNHAHSPNRTGGPRYTFVFADQAPGVTFYCRLDGKPWSVCSSPTAYRNLRRGRHVFRVKSVSPAGLESAVETIKFSAGRRQR